MPNTLLISARTQQGWTQDELAQKVGCHVGTIHRWEHDGIIPYRFHRKKLQELFQKTEADLGFLPPTLETIWNIPFARNPFFTGREGLLKQLHARLYEAQIAAISQAQAINGLGGIGKTQLAVEYAYQYRQDYQVVLWVRAETKENLATSFTELARLLRLPQQDEQEQEKIIQAVKSWLQTHNEWLLIFDNADDLTLLETFLPVERQGGHLLLTTRAQAPGRIAFRLEVRELDEESGALLLLRRSGLIASNASLEAASSSDQTCARKIAWILGGLPLALDQAGAYIEETGCGLGAYLQVYEEQRGKLLSRRGGINSFHPEPVSTTWALSFAKVSADPLAARILRVCAVLAPEAIPEEIFECAEALDLEHDAYQFDQAIAALRKYSLVQRDSHFQSLSIHRLVQAVLLVEMKNAEHGQLLSQVATALDSLFPEIKFSMDPEKWEQCERLLPHTEAVLESNLSFPVFANLAYKAGLYLYERGRYSEAELFYRKAVALQEQLLNSERLEITSVLNALAVLYWTRAQYAEAEALLERVLKIQEVANTDPIIFSKTLNNLALLLWTEGKYSEAEAVYLRALHIKDQADEMKIEPGDYARTLNNLAALYKDMGKYVDAEKLYLQAIERGEQSIGADHPQVAQEIENLAELYRVQGKYEQAEPLYLRALHSMEKIYGKDKEQHPDIARTLNNLAELYRAQGKYGQAEPLYQQALQIWEQALGTEHPLIAESLSGLAEIYLGQEKRKEALLFAERAWSICKSALGAEHHTTLERKLLYERISSEIQETN